MRDLWLAWRDVLAVIGALWVLLLVSLVLLIGSLGLVRGHRARPYRDEMQEGR